MYAKRQPSLSISTNTRIKQDRKRVASEDNDMYRRKENANEVTSNDRRKGGEGKDVAE